MIRMSRLALLAVVCLSFVAAGCDSTAFNPTGTWDISYDRAEAFSTYNSAPAIHVSTPVVELVPPGTDLTVVSGLAITYDPAAHTVSTGGMPQALDANNSFVISETTVPMMVGGCQLTECSRVSITFTGEAGHSLDYRQEAGYTVQNTGGAPTCEDLLAMTQSNIETTGMIPADLQQIVFFGGLRISTLTQVRTLGFAIVAVGERVSASQGAPGSSEQITFEFPTVYSMDTVVAARDYYWAGLVNALRAAQ